MPPLGRQPRKLHPLAEPNRFSKLNRFSLLRTSTPLGAPVLFKAVKRHGKRRSQPVSAGKSSLLQDRVRHHREVDENRDAGVAVRWRERPDAERALADEPGRY